MFEKSDNYDVVSERQLYILRRLSYFDLSVSVSEHFLAGESGVWQILLVVGAVLSSLSSLSVSASGGCVQKATSSDLG